MTIEKPTWILQGEFSKNQPNVYVCKDRQSLTKIVAGSHHVIFDTGIYMTVSAKDPDTILENDPFDNRIVAEALPAITFPYLIPEERHRLYVEKFECKGLSTIGYLALKQKDDKPMKIMRFFQKDQNNIYDEISFREYMELKIEKLYHADPEFKAFVYDYAKKNVKNRSESMHDVDIMVEATQHFL